MHQRHGLRLNAVEGEDASREVHIDSQPLIRAGPEWGLRVTVPGLEPLAIPLEAPGEVVSGNATIAFLALAVDALARQAHVDARPGELHLEVVPMQVEALLGQHLPPVCEPAGEARVRVRPGRGVGDLAVVLLQPEVPVCRVGVEGNVTGI